MDQQLARKEFGELLQSILQFHIQSLQGIDLKPYYKQTTLDFLIRKPGTRKISRAEFHLEVIQEIAQSGGFYKYYRQVLKRHDGKVFNSSFKLLNRIIEQFQTHPEWFYFLEGE